MSATLSPNTVSHPNPNTAGADRSSSWEAGITYEAFLPTAQQNVGLWEGVYKRAAVPEEILTRVAALNSSWKLLVLSADWCGDASNIIPVVQKLADEAPNVELRLLDRDDHLDLMDEHLTGVTARAIPVVIVLDENGIERAWWGPRPAGLQAWVKSDEGQALESDERYRELRKWYSRDKGRTSLDEIVWLMESSNTSANVQEDSADAFPPITDRDHVRGPEGAEITLIQYGDFECPQSRQVHVMVKGLMNSYPNKIRFVFRHFPVRTHPNALAAAEAAESAGSQGKFWEMHDRLFSNQLDLLPEQLVQHAAMVGADAKEVETSLSEDVFQTDVLIEKRGGVKAGIRSSLNLIVDEVLYEDDAVYEMLGELDQRLAG